MGLPVSAVFRKTQENVAATEQVKLKRDSTETLEMRYTTNTGKLGYKSKAVKKSKEALRVWNKYTRA